MNMRPSAAALAALLAAPAFADGHSELSGYALIDNGMTLVTMESLAAPGDAVRHPLAARLDAIAIRPVTGALLGFSREGRIYAVDTGTGALTDIGASFADDAGVTGNSVAMDFNNAIDAVRMVGDAGANLVYFPEGFGDGDERAGSVRRFTDTAYAEGDANAGTEPLIFANAYTNAIAGETAETTFQYALDARSDGLVSLANNAGTLETVGPLTVDGEPFDLVTAGGFDIVSPEEGTDMAYALLQADGSDTSGIYSIDLATGAATLLADLGAVGFSGFAVGAN